MENTISKLVSTLLSQPLILIFVVLGMIAFVYAIIKDLKQYAIYAISIVLILTLTGAFGKNVQNIVFALVIIGVMIGIAIMLLTKNKEKSVHKENIQDSTYNQPKDNVCPKCGGTLIERNGKYGRFYGCSNYPKCKYTKNIE